VPASNAGIFICGHRSIVKHVKQMSRTVIKPLISIAAASGFILLALISPAQANTLASTSPAANSVLTVTPNAVSVTAASPLIDQGNSVIVTDPSGVEVDDGSLAVNGTTAVAGMKPLTTSGLYTVTYTLLADGDTPLTGSFTFTFKAPSVISTPSPAPTSSSTPTPAGGTGTSGIVIMLLVLAVIVAVLLVWYAKQTFGGSKKKSRKR
jgi:methionine-rich copper-binding protein CopC